MVLVASQISINVKQQLLVPNWRKSQITRANLARRVTFFSKMAFGDCRQVRRVLAKQFGECWRVWRVLAKSAEILASICTRKIRATVDIA